jgi:hypothetical protein
MIMAFPRFIDLKPKIATTTLLLTLLEHDYHHWHSVTEVARFFRNGRDMELP